MLFGDARETCEGEMTLVHGKWSFAEHALTSTSVPCSDQEGPRGESGIIFLSTFSHVFPRIPTQEISGNKHEDRTWLSALACQLVNIVHDVLCECCMYHYYRILQSLNLDICTACRLMLEGVSVRNVSIPVRTYSIFAEVSLWRSVTVASSVPTSPHGKLHSRCRHVNKYQHSTRP